MRICMQWSSFVLKKIDRITLQALLAFQGVLFVERVVDNFIWCGMPTCSLPLSTAKSDTRSNKYYFFLHMSIIKDLRTLQRTKPLENIVPAQSCTWQESSRHASSCTGLGSRACRCKRSRYVNCAYRHTQPGTLDHTVSIGTQIR